MDICNDPTTIAYLNWIQCPEIRFPWIPQWNSNSIQNPGNKQNKKPFMHNLNLFVYKSANRIVSHAIVLISTEITEIFRREMMKPKMLHFNSLWKCIKSSMEIAEVARTSLFFLSSNCRLYFIMQFALHSMHRILFSARFKIKTFALISMSLFSLEFVIEMQGKFK